MKLLGTVFQAEISAITLCNTRNLESRYTNETIIILSNSQAPIKTLNSSEPVSKLVWNYLKKLLELAKRNAFVQGPESFYEIPKMLY